jgi:hypothetical protein
MSAYATPLRQATDPAVRAPALGLTRDEVLTAREVADLLKMPVSTIYELARRRRTASPAPRPNLAVLAAAA